MSRPIPEHNLQVAVVDYLRWRYDCRVLAVPNGGHMSPRMGARRKREGALAGTADLLVELPKGKHLWLELKAGKGRQSETQRVFEAESRRLGVNYYVVRSVEEAEDAVRREGEFCRRIKTGEA